MAGGRAQATRQGLADRLRGRYPRSELSLRQFEVASRRLLARLLVADPNSWVTKGGVALILRLDPSRASNDIDLAYVSAAGEHAVAVRALERGFAVDLRDFFSFELASPLSDGLGVLENDTRSVRVRALIGPQEWASFDVDLARPAADVPSEILGEVGSLTGLAAVDALSNLHVLPLPLQLAEKTCAMFERHGQSGRYSTRARDLIDVAMIASQDDVSGDALDCDLRREEARRLARGSLVAALPSEFTLDPEQEAHWRTQWTRATRGAPISFDEAFALAALFLGPLLLGDVRGTRWSAATQAWVASSSPAAADHVGRPSRDTRRP